MLCIQCHEEKELDQFYFRKNGKPMNPCKKCKVENNRNNPNQKIRVWTEEQLARKLELSKVRYQKKNQEIKLKQKEYRENNKEKIREKHREWKKNNPEAVLKNRINWRNSERYREYSKEYREKNKEKRISYLRKYREENKDLLKEKKKKRNEANREEYLAKKKAYRDSHKEMFRLRSKKYYEANKDILKEKRKSWYLKSGKEWAKKYHERNRDRILETRRKYTHENPDKFVKYRLKYWESRGEITTDHIINLHKWQDNRCAYCGIVIDKNNQHIDHVVPLSKDGSNHPHNIVLACVSCNTSKGSKLLGLEWPLPKPTSERDYFSRDIRYLQQELLKEGIETTRENEFLIHQDKRIIVLSSFFGSERFLGKNAKKIMYEHNNPSTIIFWDDELKTRIHAVISLIKHHFGLSNHCFARNLKLIEVDGDKAKIFFDKIHLQGNMNASVRLALTDGDKLYGISSFILKDGSWDLSRIAFDGSVVGGFSRFIKNFIDKYMEKGQSLFSYVDSRIGTGMAYERFGFSSMGETDFPYSYSTPTGIIHRLRLSKGTMAKTCDWTDMNQTETVNATANGFFKIFGVPHKRYILKK